jgi:ribose 5-phosphate isomerase B
MNQGHPEVSRWFVGADHRGFSLKRVIVGYLAENGLEVEDVGSFDAESVDYPLIALRLARKVAASPHFRGVLLCGSGVGMSIMANRLRGVRAALAWSEEVAKLSRAHNDANVLVLPAAFLDTKTTLEVIKVWMVTPFDGGRHLRRVRMMDEIGQELC